MNEQTLDSSIARTIEEIYRTPMPKEVKISDIKKWTNDYLKWYKKTYHIGEDVFKGTPYGIQNQYTLEVLTSIFEHMEDDLENGRFFSEKSEEFYTKLVTED